MSDYDPFDEDAYSPAMTHWFGQPWPWPNLPAPVCADRRFHIDTPVDEPCFECHEPITADESGVRIPYFDGTTTAWAYSHAECFLRNVMCPVCMGMKAGPHADTAAGRRAEGRLLMKWSREQTA